MYNFDNYLYKYNLYINLLLLCIHYIYIKNTMKNYFFNKCKKNYLF